MRVFDSFDSSRVFKSSRVFESLGLSLREFLSSQALEREKDRRERKIGERER